MVREEGLCASHVAMGEDGKKSEDQVRIVRYVHSIPSSSWWQSSPLHRGDDCLPVSFNAPPARPHRSGCPRSAYPGGDSYTDRPSARRRGQRRESRRHAVRPVRNRPPNRSRAGAPASGPPTSGSHRSRLLHPGSAELSLRPDSRGGRSADPARGRAPAPAGRAWPCRGGAGAGPTTRRRCRPHCASTRPRQCRAVRTAQSAPARRDVGRSLCAEWRPAVLSSRCYTCTGSVTKRLLCIPVLSTYECKTRGEEKWHCPPRGEADAQTRKPCHAQMSSRAPSKPCLRATFLLRFL